jgi:hypothetical protein
MLADNLRRTQYAAAPLQSMTAQPIAEKPKLLLVGVEGWVGILTEYFPVSS